MKPDYRKIGIIGAMGVEVKLLRSMMTETTEETVSGIEYVSGKLAGADVVIAKCGVGKVFAALCTQTMLLRYAPDCIINVGVAGALGGGLKIGSVAIADQVVQHDMDTSAIGDPVGLISGINQIYLPCSGPLVELLRTSVEALHVHYAVGTIASGDRFVCRTDEKERIVSLFGAIACEMEGAAIGHVCYVNNVDCAILRAISDGGDEDSQLDYSAFVRSAADQAARIILDLLARLQAS